MTTQASQPRDIRVVFGITGEEAQGTFLGVRPDVKVSALTVPLPLSAKQIVSACLPGHA